MIIPDLVGWGAFTKGKYVRNDNVPGIGDSDILSCSPLTTCMSLTMRAATFANAFIAPGCSKQMTSSQLDLLLLRVRTNGNLNDFAPYVEPIVDDEPQKVVYWNGLNHEAPNNKVKLVICNGRIVRKTLRLTSKSSPAKLNRIIQNNLMTHEQKNEGAGFCEDSDLKLGLYLRLNGASEITPGCCINSVANVNDPVQIDRRSSASSMSIGSCGSGSKKRARLIWRKTSEMEEIYVMKESEPVFPDLESHKRAADVKNWCHIVLLNLFNRFYNEQQSWNEIVVFGGEEKEVKMQGKCSLCREKREVDICSWKKSIEALQQAIENCKTKLVNSYDFQFRCQNLKHDLRMYAQYSGMSFGDQGEQSLLHYNNNKSEYELLLSDGKDDPQVKARLEKELESLRMTSSARHRCQACKCVIIN